MNIRSARRAVRHWRTAGWTMLALGGAFLAALTLGDVLLSGAGIIMAGTGAWRLVRTCRRRQRRVSRERRRRGRP